MKRKIEREIEELSDEVLEALSSTDRLESVLHKIAEEKPGQIERLEETAARETYSIRDPEYVAERLATQRLAERWVFDLERLYLLFQWSYHADVLLVIFREADGNIPDVDPQPERVLWQLALKRDKYADFVAQEFDADFEEFVAQVDGGPEVLSEVDQTLHRYRQLLDDSREQVARSIAKNERETAAETGQSTENE